MNLRPPVMLWFLALSALGAARPAPAADAGTELFESRIRPVLVDHCYECHNSETKAEGGLALDFRDGLRDGGTSGPALVPGKPDASLILKAVRHGDPKLRMPRGGAKLSESVIADFARWVALGAPDPRVEPPTAAELRSLTSWEAVRDRRKNWWSFRPLTDPPPPPVRRAGWSDQPVDRFLLARMEERGLEPADPADRSTLLRRVAFALSGLPPTPGEVERFLGDPSPRAYDEAVDRLLGSPRFGERWARHWMDWFRYADSHGSEGDPSIPHAWRYRDYLVRALNADVPYDRLVREHLAGDLLPDPRVNRDLGVNESALGVGHYRMVAHGFAPTDALDEQVTFTDNQVDVLTKAFLGLTVSCARCHDHKFDPISQADFYALYGVMASARPALITVDTPERLLAHRDELRVRKGQIRRELAGAWIRALPGLPARLRKPLPEDAKTPGHPLHAWSVLSGLDGEAFAPAWSKLRADPPAPAGPATRRRWVLSGKDHGDWFRHGNGLPDAPSPPGEFPVTAVGDRIVTTVHPAGVYTNTLSDKHNGVLTSPRFKIDTDFISARLAGGGGARARFVVQNYPRATGLIYPSSVPDGDGFRWYRWDSAYWKGEWAYIEIATSEDLPVEVKPNGGRSWFGVTEVVCHDRGWTPDPGPRLPAALARGNPRSPADLAALYADALREAVAAWGAGTADDDQANLLGAAVRARLLPDTLDALPGLAPPVADYRRVEAEVPVPTRAPGVLEGTPFDQPVFLRGNPKTPGGPVPRRFLEVFDSKPFATPRSGRLELADEFVAPRNPLTPRVIVNRLWHHLFGRGLAATPDNLGRLGEPPTHPELLDALASRFVADGWSLKRTIRRIVTTRAYRMSSLPSGAAAGRDPSNLTLSHFPVRRLEAEALRDAILAVSGQLDETRGGPDVPGRSRRRSVYVRVQRNDLDPFLNAFDAPEPFTTRGRRDTTNVPAQSLTLLNDPWVIEQAASWAEGVARDPSAPDDDERVRRMFVTALGRPPTADELDQCRQFLADTDRERVHARREAERITTEITTRRDRIAALTAPARAHLPAPGLTDRRHADAPEPIARWEFDGDLRDAVGRLHGRAVGKARLEGSALVLDGRSYVETEPLDRPLTSKTLEALVVLDDTDQRGSGLIATETLDGGVFDAIVFGEFAPGHWLAGSDFFRRTQPFHGDPETDAVRRPVRIAVAYQADGTIAAYRDGKPYGRPYRSGGPIRFAAGEGRVLFGLRHSPAAGGKFLKGKILRARLYDRALSPAEVAASARDSESDSADAAVLAALPAGDRGECERLAREIADLAAERATHRTPDGPPSGPAGRWQALAHAVFNFKEFLYTR